MLDEGAVEDGRHRFGGIDIGLSRSIAIQEHHTLRPDANDSSLAWSGGMCGEQIEAALGASANAVQVGSDDRGRKAIRPAEEAQHERAPR